jgi:phospholipid-binding lipoprotein MlaA
MQRKWMICLLLIVIASLAHHDVRIVNAAVAKMEVSSFLGYDQEAVLTASSEGQDAPLRPGVVSGEAIPNSIRTNNTVALKPTQNSAEPESVSPFLSYDQERVLMAQTKEGAKKDTDAEGKIWRKDMVDDLEKDEDLDEEFDEELEEMIEEPISQINDPLEPFNRAMFIVNRHLYFAIWNPFVQTWKALLIEPVRTGIRNVFSNLLTGVRLASCLLQLKMPQAFTELGRFGINTTIGVLGLNDAAKKGWGLEKAREDLGQAFGKWGLGHGFYLFLPVYGPTSVRDFTGWFLERYFDPTWLTEIQPFSFWLAIKAVQWGNEGSFRIGEFEAILDATFDPYAAIRDGYYQYRQKLVDE